MKAGKLPSLIEGFDTSWFLNLKEAGFGGFGDIGIHAIDAIIWLTGMKVVKVKGFLFKRDDLNVDYMGHALLELSSEEGKRVIASLVSGWFNPVGFPTWLDVRFEILTKDSFLVIDKPYHDYWLYTDKAARQYWWRTDVDSVVDDFVRSILEDRSPQISAEDALEALRVLETIYESAKTGEEIPVGDRL